MGKRFISTEIFSDEWFSDLSKDGKLFFIYYITNCDHAGVLKLNRKLAEFQLGIKSMDTVIKELNNCLVRVKEGVFWMPKFIKFQYPGFPKSNVKQQDSALKILNDLGIDFNNLQGKETVSQELANSYDIDSVNGNVSETENGGEKLNFPFPESFKPVWEKWKSFKKSQFKRWYKDISSENTGLAKLFKDSNQNPLIAEEMINNSIANMYQGIFPLDAKMMKMFPESLNGYGFPAGKTLKGEPIFKNPDGSMYRINADGKKVEYREK